jgi:hypothetical protein
MVGRDVRIALSLKGAVPCGFLCLFYVSHADTDKGSGSQVQTKLLGWQPL